MTTTTCTVTWPDGATAELTITAQHPNDEAPVNVSGDGADRFTVWPQRSRPSLLPRQVGAIVARSNAIFVYDDVTIVGRYPEENDVR